jgi:hypothetical protein
MLASPSVVGRHPSPSKRCCPYRLWIADARFGTSWDDWSEEKELARRDAQDAWLVEQLGAGVRVERPSGSVLG